MRKLTLILTLSFLALGCGGKKASGDGTCSSNEQCSAGEVCLDDACAAICSTDRDCAGGEICGGQSVCVPGSRNVGPEIAAIDSDGAPDPNSTDGKHHVRENLIITGTHLLGSSVALLGVGDVDLAVVASTDDSITAALPTDLVEGTYTVQVYNAAGSDQAGVTLLQGEPGPEGPTGPMGPQGPAGPLDMIRTDTTLQVPADYADISAALSSLDDFLIAANATVTIQVADGIYTYGSAISFRHPNGNKIRIVGNETDATAVTLNFSDSNGLNIQEGHHLAFLNGFRLRGDPAFSGRDGIFVQRSSTLTLGDQMQIDSFGRYGLRADRNSMVDANNLQVTNCGDSGIYASHGSTLMASSATSSNNGAHGFYALRNSYLHASNAIADGNDNWGFIAYEGSAIYANGAAATNNLRGGFYAWLGSSMRLDGALAENNDNTNSQSAHGILADHGSSIYAYRADALNNRNHGVYAVRGSSIFFAGRASDADRARANNNGGWGLYATLESIIDGNAETRANSNGNGASTPARDTEGSWNSIIEY